MDSKNPAVKVQRKVNRREEALKQRNRKIAVISTIAVVIVAFVIFAIVKAATAKDKAAEFDYASQPAIGSATAPVKIVEFGDFKCPACQAFEQQIYPQLKKDYIDTGKVQLHFMNLPFIGPDSVTAALAGEAVFHQNKDAFWPFYEAVYKNQGDEKAQWATADFLVNLAKQANVPVDYDKLKSDIQNKTYQSDVVSDNDKGGKLKVTSTPSLFINGKLFDSPFDYNKLKAAIDKAAAGQ